MATVCESSSILTTSPTALSPNVVARSVSGMSHTQNVSGVTSPTVKLHPSTAMKPCAREMVSYGANHGRGATQLARAFGRMYFMSACGTLNTTLRFDGVTSMSEMAAVV